MDESDLTLEQLQDMLDECEAREILDQLVMMEDECDE